MNLYICTLYLFKLFSGFPFRTLEFKMVILIEDIHNSWLYCFTNPLELRDMCSAFTSSAVCVDAKAKHVSLNSRGFMKQYNQELCISSITRCFSRDHQNGNIYYGPHSTYSYAVHSLIENLLIVNILLDFTINKNDQNSN